MCIEHQYNFCHIYHNHRKIIEINFQCKLLLGLYGYQKKKKKIPERQQNFHKIFRCNFEFISATAKVQKRMRDYNNSKSLQSKVCVKDFGFYMELLSKNFKQPYGGYVGIVCYNLIKQTTNSCL